jgi:hypothetical protein
LVLPLENARWLLVKSLLSNKVLRILKEINNRKLLWTKLRPNCGKNSLNFDQE